MSTKEITSRHHLINNHDKNRLMCNIKKDNLISVGFIITENSDNRFILEKLTQLHNILVTQYNHFEIIIVDNGENSHVAKIQKQLTNIRLITLQFDVDMEISNSVLVENCIGDYLCLLDIEHDPIDKIIEMLLSAEDCDVIIGKRIKKVQTIFDRLTSRLFYAAINALTDIEIDSAYSDFFVINRKVINAITKNTDKVKFLKLIKLSSGFVKKEFEYMPIGKKSYQRSILYNINYTIDIIVNHSHKLIRIATILSLFTALFNMMYAFYVISVFIFKTHVAEGWTSMQLYDSFINFVLFLVLAILGEYIRMILLHQKDNPSYEIANESNSVALFSDRKNVEME